MQLMVGVKERLEKLKYPQVPNLVGPKRVLREEVPWCGESMSSTTKWRGERDE